jgi:formamidopyrimidine-DNA glycosylase
MNNLRRVFSYHGGMPELPEVEVIARQLKKEVERELLLRIITHDPSIWEEGSLPPSSIEGSRIKRVFRRGKYLILSGERGDLLLHLRMTGRLLREEKEGDRSRSFRLRLVFSHRILIFSDTRRLGKVRIVPSALGWLKERGFGCEPLPYNRQALDALVASAQKTSRPIKSLLLDQGILAGLGNIYADEALHRSQIHPQTPASSLSSGRLATLYQAIITVLYEAIQKRGTSMRDYLDLRGEKGQFQRQLRVYRREGETCLSCRKGTIERIVLSGRSSFFCPICQNSSRR